MHPYMHHGTRTVSTLTDVHTSLKDSQSIQLLSLSFFRILQKKIIGTLALPHLQFEGIAQNCQDCQL